MLSLYKKELKYYFGTPLGYIITILFAVFANFIFVKDIFVVGSASMQPFFTLIPWLFVIFIPAITMRSLSEEKRLNTMEILLTLPLSETEIVIAKLLALLSITFFGLLLTLGLPISLSFLTPLAVPEIVVGYIGTLFLANAFISLSLFVSQKTKNQVVAFLVSSVLLFTSLVLSTDFLANSLAKSIQDMMSGFTPIYHFSTFIRGVLDIRSIFYFILLSGVILLFTIFDLEKRQ